MPRISVCIPTYNSASYLPQTIESVFRQDFADYELIVCDNASTDQTPAILDACRDPRLRRFRFEELVEQPGNWNRCLAVAEGEFVILLHSDDLLKPSYLSKALALMEQHSDVGL